jgi:hypothetical protein
VKWAVCAAPVLVVLTFGVSPTNSRSMAQAQSTPITVPSSTVVGIALAAAADYQAFSDEQWKDYEDIAIIAALNGAAKNAANTGQPITISAYTSLATQMRSWLDANSPASQTLLGKDLASRLRYAVDTLCAMASSAPAGSPLPALFGDLEALKFHQLADVFDLSRQIPFDPATYSRTGAAHRFVADRIQEASELAANDPQYATALNSILDDLTGFDNTSSYSAIQAVYTGLPTLPAPNSDGSYTIDIQDLVSQYQSVVGAIQSTVDQDIAAFEAGSSPAVASRPKSKVPASDSSALPLDTRGGSGGGDLSKCGDPCKAAQSDVTAISKLVGLSDSTLGSQISTVGGAAISAGFAIDQIYGGGLGAILSATTLGGVGTVVGAAVDIFSSIFGSSSSSANAAVLAQLKDLSKQLANLQKDMDAQFAKVDATLNSITNLLNQNFAQIDYTLGALTGDAHAIQVGLLDIQTQINQLEQYTQAYFQATELTGPNGFDYQATICLGQATLPNITSCEADFYNWAYNTAASAVWALPVADYTDGNIYNVFEDAVNSGITGCDSSGCPTPFAVDINYLAQFPAQNLGLPALWNSSLGPLANPDEWTRGARAYLELAHEWPQAVSGVGNEAQHLSDMIFSGSAIQQAAEAANSINNGGTITANLALFTAATNKGSAASSSLQSAILGVVNSYITNPANNLQEGPGNGYLNLWGGPNQTNTYVPKALQPGGADVTNLPDCPNDLAEGPYSTPANLASLLPNVIKTTEQLGLGTVTACLAVYDLMPAGDAQVNMPYNPWDPVDLYQYQLQVQVDGQFYYPSFFIVAFEYFPNFSPPIAEEIWQSGYATMAPNYGANPYLISATPIPIGSCQTLSNATSGPSPVIENLTPSFAAFVSQNPNLYLCGLSGTPIVNLFVPYSFLMYDPTPQLNALSTNVANTLAADQQQLYGDIAAAFGTAGPVESAGQLLTGTTLLSQAYANFGLSSSLESDDTLHSLLYGNQGIYVSSAVQSDFADFAAGPINDTDNKVTDEISAINSRISALSHAFTTDLNQIQQNQAPQSLDEVDVTLEDLQSFGTLENANALWTCAYQLSSTLATIAAAGGTGTISVQEPHGCAWTASTGANWLSVAAGASGAGNGSVSFSAAPNAGPARDGIFIIGDQVFHVIEAGGLTGPVVSVSPTSLSFGSQTVGATSPAQPVTLTNTGAATVNFSFAVIGTNNGDFVANSACGTTIQMGASCSVNVVFTASGTGTRSASLTITDDAGDGTQTVTLAGTGILPVTTAPAVGLSPSSLTFPGQLVGTTSGVQNVTLSNTGSAVLNIVNISTSGDFLSPTNNCGSSVAAGAACTIQVAFSASAVGSQTGDLIVTDNTSNSPQMVPLNGTGTVNPVPVVSQSLAPTSAAPGGSGFTLAVSGMGFAPGAVVNWNGSSRTTNFVLSTQVTAAISALDIATAGTAAITVTNPSPGGGTSNVVFFPITTPIPTIALEGTPFPTGTLPRSVAVGDFNGDSKQDLAIVNTKDNTISVLLGKGDGTFSGHVDYPTGGGPVSVAVADLNGDGKPDLAVVNQTDNTVSILLGRGDGTFAPHVDYPTGHTPAAVAAADLLSNAKLDLVVVNQGDNTVSVLLGNGDGTFAPSGEYPTGTTPVSVAIADFNGDGKPDLAVVNQNDNTVAFLAGDGDGTFAPPVAYETGVSPVSVQANDFNGDSKMDLAVVNQKDNTVSILLGKGDGTFSVHVDYPTGNAPVSLAVGDFHGGGRLDLAVVNQKDNTLSILAGNGDGTFASHVDYGTGSSPSSVAVADFNGDGRLDLAVTNQGDNTVTVFLTSSVADVQPSSLTFDNEPIGVPSPAQTVNVKNKGTTTLTFANIQSTSEFPQTNSCENGIAPQAACTISVSFDPTVAGPITGTLTIAGPLIGTVSVTLSGTGTTPSVTVSPTTLTFGNQVVGTTSAAQAVTLNNAGTAPVTISNIAVSGDFAQTNNCGSSVAVGSNCAINVTFAPSAAGNRTGMLSISDNAPASPQNVALSGGGSDFSLTVASESSSTASVSAGQTANFNLSLTPTNGFNSQVSFTCTGAPAYATCTVTPNPATISGSSATPITVNVATTGSSRTGPRGPVAPPSPGRFRHPWVVWELALFLAALGWLSWRRRPASAFEGPAHWRFVPVTSVLLIVLLALGLVISACGGGSSGSGPGPSSSRTPSGSYTLTVTGTPTSGPTTLHHDLTLTLNVN